MDNIKESKESIRKGIQEIFGGVVRIPERKGSINKKLARG